QRRRWRARAAARAGGHHAGKGGGEQCGEEAAHVPHTPDTPESRHAGNGCAPPGRPGRGAERAKGEWLARCAHRLAELGQELVEAVVALLDAVAHAVLDHAVAIGHGLEDGVAANAAPPTADVLDGQLIERDMARVALELEG